MDAHAQTREELDSIVSEFVADARPVGLAVALISPHSAMYVRTTGTQRFGVDLPVTTSTAFHLASVTKAITGIAVMQLADAGMFGLDDPVSKHLPLFVLDDSRFRQITIRQLLNHTSGLPHAETYNWDKPQVGDSALANYVRSLRPVTLLFDPGVQWSYSDLGYEVLGALVAHTSRMTFEQYVKARILDPARMTNSDLLLHPMAASRLAAPHTRDLAGHPLVSDVYPYNREHAPSSTLHSDITDMSRWAEILLSRGTRAEGEILAPATLEEMWRPTTVVELPEGAIPGIPSKLAVGLTFFTWQQGVHRIVWHGGDDLGFSTSLMLAPDHGIAVVVLGNERFVPVHRLASSLISAALAPQRQ